MQMTAAKTISAVAIAGVAALGAQYAGAAPTHQAHAQVAPIRNVSHLYSVSTAGGTGQVTFTVPNPGTGAYIASFSANFYPQGTPAAPKTFSCYIIKDGQLRTQETATSTYDSGFYIGVNGTNSVKLLPTTSLTVGCGLADGGDWTWGTRPLQVLLTQVDALGVAGMSKMTQKSTLIPSTTSVH